MKRRIIYSNRQTHLSQFFQPLVVPPLNILPFRDKPMLRMPTRPLIKVQIKVPVMKDKKTKPI